MADVKLPTPKPVTLEQGSDAQRLDTQVQPGSSGLQRTFAALRHPNYRLWFRGQLVSMIGTWMQTSAQGFLVFQLTHSTAYLGYVGFAAGVPSLLFMLFGGVIADRVARRKLLVITQSTMMLLAFILAALTFLHVVQPWHIVLLALGLGTANAFDAPAGQAFVLELVDREDLTNAIALNSSLMNLATVVGPTVAGLTYAAFGPAWCFTLNGLSFVAVIAALLRMHLPAHVAAPRTQSALAQLKEGVRYTLADPLLRLLIIVPAVAVLFSAIYATLLPAWAVEVLHGNATTNGLLQSARGIGSLLGALMIAALAHFGWRGRWLTAGMFVYPLMLLVLATVRTLPLSIVALAGVGWGGMVLYNMANTLLQVHVPDALRGRVMSIYSMIMFGGIPLGALWAGQVARVIGPPRTIMFSAVVSLVSAMLFWILAPQVRRLV
ncbi:MAG: MFS transporter [Herpetosiphonaceae bacterium]|nr:MFS transporter [Herpetosiphonaceae bacterium]